LGFLVAGTAAGCSSVLGIDDAHVDPLFGAMNYPVLKPDLTLVIDVDHKSENVKIGTGSGRPDAAGLASGDSVTKSAESQHEAVVRLMLLGEPISEFVNERPVPGLMFGWAPRGTGAIAYTDRDGRLKLLDQESHKRTIANAKDALLPAWSNGGTRLAWVQKSGRKKYVLMVAEVNKT